MKDPKGTKDTQGSDTEPLSPTRETSVPARSRVIDQ